MKATQIIAQLQCDARNLNARQVRNSVSRSLAHAERKGSAIEKATWRKALRLATEALEQAHSTTFVPCSAECMTAHADECKCHCSGKNHGVSLKGLSAALAA
jgi:hypothetical protein